MNKLNDNREKKTLSELNSNFKFNEDEVQCFIKLTKGVKEPPTVQMYCEEDMDLVIGMRVLIKTMIDKGFGPNWIALEILDAVKDKTDNIKIITLKGKDN